MDIGREESSARSFHWALVMSSFAIVLGGVCLGIYTAEVGGTNNFATIMLLWGVMLMSGGLSVGLSLIARAWQEDAPNRSKREDC
jgi:cytochrome b subunit of formate dehydrogenase